MSKNSNKTEEIRDKCVCKLNEVIQDESLSRKVEQSLYNYVVTISKERRIRRVWGNQMFKNLYNSKIISIYSNLKKDSYVNNPDFLK